MTMIPPTMGQPETAANGWNAVGLLGIVSVIWGAIFPLTNIAVHNGLTPITIATFRILLAATLLLGLSQLFRSDLHRFRTQDIRRLWPIALLLFVVPYILMAWSQYYISSSHAVIVLATIPLMTTLFISFAGRAGPPPAGELSGALLGTIARLTPGFIGIVLLMGESAFNKGTGHFIGSLAAIASSMSCAAAIYLMSRLPPMPAVRTSTSLCFIAGAVMLPICLVIDVPWTLAPSANGLLALVLLGLVCTGLSSTLYIRLTSGYGAVFASLSFYVSPISGLVLSHVLLGEAIGSFYLSAIALVLISVYLVSPPLRLAGPLQGTVRSGHGSVPPQTLRHEDQESYQHEKAG